jgi:hypothetical protein
MGVKTAQFFRSYVWQPGLPVCYDDALQKGRNLNGSADAEQIRRPAGKERSGRRQKVCEPALIQY